MAGSRPSTRSRHLPGAGPDAAVGEVVAYIFMLGMGTIALIITMNVMTETQGESADIASGIQLKQAGEIAAAHIQEASRVASVAPNADYQAVFSIPEAVGQQSYAATVDSQLVDDTDPTKCSDWVLKLSTDDNTATAEIALSNTGRVTVDGECLQFESGRDVFHSSMGQVQIRYDPDPDPDTAPNPDPTLYFENPTR